MSNIRLNQNDFKLSDLHEKYVVLFFWPSDFTFVCPTEIIAHDHRLAQFKERGVEVVGVSIDSKFTHHAWKNTEVKAGGIGNIQFPIVADIRDGIVQNQVVNNMPLGRNVDEMIRIVDALQFHEQHGEVCPAGWVKGESGMAESAEGVASYLSDHADDL